MLRFKTPSPQERDRQRAAAEAARVAQQAARLEKQARRAELPPRHTGPPTTRVVLKGNKQVVVPTKPTLPKIPGGIAMKTAGRKRKSKNRKTLKRRNK